MRGRRRLQHQRKRTGKGRAVMRRLGLSWRRRCATTALVMIAGSLVFAAGALADAGNPILNTITASSVDNGDTVTITVKGQWNWQSHGSDCNFDRAATGAAIAWSDKNGRLVGTNEVQRITLTGTTAGASFTVKYKSLANITTTSGTIL